LTGRPVVLDQDPALCHLVLHARGQLAGGLAGAAIVDELDAGHQAAAADVADRFVALGQRAKQRDRSESPTVAAFATKVLVLEHVQDRQRRGARDGVAAEASRRTSSARPNPVTISAG
jgi:hypothetical protein